MKVSVDPFTVAYNDAVDKFQSGDLDGALAKALEATKLQPERANGFDLAAKIAARKKDWDQALPLAEKSLALDPDNTSVLGILVEGYRAKGDKAKAAEYEKKFVAANPDSPDVLYNQAVELYNKNDFKGAEPLLLKVLAAKPDHAQAHFLIGMCDVNLNKIPDMKTHLTKYIELDPKGKDVGPRRKCSTPSSDAVTPFVIGIAGGTGSGKTTVANAIVKRVGEERIAFLSHDSYYRDFVDLPKDILDRQNFDHPDSLETELLVRHLKALKQGMVVETPIYDFKVHRRAPEETRRVEPRKGHPRGRHPHLRRARAPEALRREDLRRHGRRHPAHPPHQPRHRRARPHRGKRRRAVRVHRAPHAHGVRRAQSKRYADLIVPEGGENTVALDFLFARLQELLS